MKPERVIVWFRQDLRITDNPALHYAAQQGEIIPVYIQDEHAPEYAQLGGASKWWLHQSLQALASSLDENLLLFSGDIKVVLEKLLKASGATQIVWNRCYEPWQIARDTELKSWLKKREVEVKSFNASLLWEPMRVLKKDGTPYKVFTPYYRKGCLNAESPRYPVGRPETMAFTNVDVESKTLEALELLPTINWYADMQALWQPGEEGAAQRLSEFLQDRVSGYRDNRNFPATTGTSTLSPYLHFGEISPNQVWYAALDRFKGSMDNQGLDTFLSELGWREFSYYLLFHFPDIQHKNFNSKFDQFPWRTDNDSLIAWQRGNTGVPIVDAGMRELWKTGYMHNRVRMIVGSFLVKNLLIDWREGERWFWDCLLDADMASNSASWQWVAGSGADAAPYFRIFNPVLQGEKFDKQGEYVKTYCPELKDLPAKYIHKPWEAPDEVLKKAGIVLGEDYPEPLVDLKTSRQRALDAFSEIKG
ncbi:cryptochrome/photolyase family protein [Aestuariibacter salexigens]|uniref:cryptochrome/photolyase family protein n=1 Tax=Aestuariibacter salexigens TaxID=226010 RepID=UPI0003F6C5C7|nr:deoxyribodipyrimidine photo-lyase [Aestuariibacter salexigens]